MGGVAGHLNHLYDDPDLSFGKIKKILSLASQGKLEFKEKIDGWNSYYSFRDGKAVIARNKSNIKDGGLDLEGISKREFAGGDKVKQTYLEATKDFQDAIRRIPERTQKILFKNGLIWYNCEILGPAASNVINYDKNTIKIHDVGTLEYNPQTGEIVPYKNEKNAAMLDKVIEQSQQQEGGQSFQIKSKAVNQLKNLSMDKSLKIAKMKIDRLLSNNGLSDSNTIEDYLRSNFYKFVKKQLPETSEELINVIVDNLLGKSKIPAGLSKDLRQRITQIKSQRDSLYKSFIFPLEEIIHEYAVDLLQGMESAFILDNSKESQRIKDEVQKAINAIQTSGNEEANKILTQQLQKLKSIENISTAIEGVVFEHDGKVYKFTGNFAPINQILGLFRYGRGGKKMTSDKLDELDKRSRNKIVAIIPGGFKPPHAGHFAVAKYFADMPEVDFVKILISPKERAGHSTNSRITITAEQSLAIWKIYSKLEPKIKPEIAPDNSPVKSVYDFIVTLNPGDTAVLGMGEKEIKKGDTRFAKAQEYVDKNAPGVKVQIMPIPPQHGGVNGGQMRELVALGDKKTFLDNLPPQMPSQEKEAIWNIVSPQDKSLEEISSMSSGAIEGAITKSPFANFNKKENEEEKEKSIPKQLEEYETHAASHEPYQDLMRKLHPKWKERLIGKGGQKTDVAGSPYKTKPSMKRSLSAPPMEESYMRDRNQLIEEMKLRQYIRKLIPERINKKKEETLLQESLLRKYIKKLILEASSEDSDIPHNSTGINVLEDLLKKIVPVIEEDYKSLTTDPDQRKSFREHLLNAIQNTLIPARVKKEIGDEDSQPPIGEGEVDIKIGDNGEENKDDVPDIGPEGFIDISKKKPSHSKFTTLPGEDLTGRNMAMRTYEKIEKQISEAYTLLSNEEDENIFYDYLLTNVKLYADKWEDELKGSLEEPSTPEYEEEKGESTTSSSLEEPLNTKV